MFRIQFSNESIQNLQEQQKIHPHHVVRRRMLILILKSQKIPHYKIAKIADVCENTVCSCLRAYQEGGIEQLKAINF
jgi:transposase